MMEIYNLENKIIGLVFVLGFMEVKKYQLEIQIKKVFLGYERDAQ